MKTLLVTDDYDSIDEVSRSAGILADVPAGDQSVIRAHPRHNIGGPKARHHRFPRSLVDDQRTGPRTHDRWTPAKRMLTQNYLTVRPQSCPIEDTCRRRIDLRDPRVNCRRTPVDDHTIDTDQWHNVVDRSFDVSEQWRALATRYGKPALT